MSATTVGDEPVSEETLADSFPASDPPSWTLGRDRYHKAKEPDTAIIETAKTNNKEESTMNTELNQIVDDVAERARSLAGWAFGTLTEFFHSTPD